MSKASLLSLKRNTDSWIKGSRGGPAHPHRKKQQRCPREVDSHAEWVRDEPESTVDG